MRVRLISSLRYMIAAGSVSVASTPLSNQNAFAQLAHQGGTVTGTITGGGGDPSFQEHRVQNSLSQMSFGDSWESATLGFSSSADILIRPQPHGMGVEAWFSSGGQISENGCNCPTAGCQFGPSGAGSVAARFEISEPWIFRLSCDSASFTFNPPDGSSAAYEVGISRLSGGGFGGTDYGGSVSPQSDQNGNLYFFNSIGHFEYGLRPGEYQFSASAWGRLLRPCPGLNGDFDYGVTSRFQLVEPCLRIDEYPESQSTHRRSASFHVGAFAPAIAGPISYTWQIWNGEQFVDLQDGLHTVDMIFVQDLAIRAEGTRTHDLTLVMVLPRPADVILQCSMVNACGSKLSDVAWIRFLAPYSADFNDDGEVSLVDLTILLSNFGTVPTSGENGDADSDGDVDLTDLAILLGQFGLS